MSNLSFLHFVSFFLQELIIKPFAKFHLDLFTLASKKTLFIAAPRGHAKSHIFARFYLLYKLYTCPGINIILVSASEDIAKEHFSEVKRQIEHNKFLQAIFGPQHNLDKWTENHIILKNGSSARAIGAEAKFRGRRPDLIIVDDLESDEGVRSETTRKHLRDWFIKVLLNTLKPNGQLVVIGTILADCSLLNELITSDAWAPAHRVRYQALAKDNTALWPQEWPKEKLLEKKKIDPIAFATEYQNDPSSDDITLIKKDWICDGGVTPSYFKAVICGVDPAATKKTMNDYSALVFLGITSGREPKGDDKGEACRIYEIETIAQRLHFPELKEILWNKYKEYKEKKIPITKFVIEQSMTGAALYQDLFAAHPELHGIIEPIGTKNKDKITRLKAIAHLFANERVYIKTKELYHDLLHFPGVAHDDRVDACVHALTKIDELNLLELIPQQEDKYKHLDRDSARFWKRTHAHWDEFFEGDPYTNSGEYKYINELDGY